MTADKAYSSGKVYPLLRVRPALSDGSRSGSNSSPLAAAAGPSLRGAIEKIGRWTIQIVKRSDTAIGFEVIPRRWVVERTFAWLGRCRRMAKDWEKTSASAEAWLRIAHIRRVTRMLARQ